ncbi:NAD-dependent histone deacetylase HST3 [Choanephora cucurbitarum]|uniref:NAD-dependent histone deacetylase HST3 n=1 Tax=Choanephora cucurbitarum TaxID=101091 RepID=A0A1C7NKY6_9FUNG|nr:NAD-dependent histone deacetylase HST3 [Choanephora cucurbitarum]
MRTRINISEPTKVDDLLITELANCIKNSRKALVITGAGISCSSGIPDFRSANGLYDLVKRKYPGTVLKGQDLFDAHLFKDQRQTQCFYTLMAELKSVMSAATPTLTHTFIRALQERGQLMRCYTQNIDCLEDSVELSVVRLHGAMDRVKCTLCTASYEFTSDYEALFRTGLPPVCPQCELFGSERIKLGKRSLSMGTLRPNIVLYNEAHPDGETIGRLQCTDLRRKPDLMIVMGTSLKIPGLKRFIKQAAKQIHSSSKNGKVVFVNKTAPSKEWDKVFDYEVLGDTDDWVKLTQTKLGLKLKNESDATKIVIKRKQKPLRVSMRLLKKYKKKLC